MLLKHQVSRPRKSPAGSVADPATLGGAGCLRHLGARLALGAVLLAAALACRTADVFVAQAPKPTSTRTPRPTFTPIPPATDTPEPTPTFLPTPTRRPTPRPTPRPTARPTVPPPPPPPAATTPPYRYQSANKGCEHSGQTFIQGTIYHGQDHVNGVTVVMSGAPDGAIADQKVSGADGDGFYSMIVEAAGAAPGQKRWVWIVENGKRASDIVEFDFNNLKEDNPASCWRGFVDFVQLY